MKTLLNKFPTSSRFILAFLFYGLVLIGSGLINKGLIKQYFPYISSILLFTTTWLLLKMDKQSLATMGLNFSVRNLLFLPFGILIGAFAFLGARLLRMLYLGEEFEISTSINYSTIFSALYFILPQVATEEFLFRGYLFQKTIKTTSLIIANVLFSILFMLIHVLDESVMNNIGMMLMLGITIPIGHLLFASALLKSRTLLFPIGIHLGNNWATRHLLKVGMEGDSFLYISNPVTFDTWTPFIVSIFLFNGFQLLIILVIWKWNAIRFRGFKNVINDTNSSHPHIQPL